MGEAKSDFYIFRSFFGSFSHKKKIKQLVTDQRLNFNIDTVDENIRSRKRKMSDLSPEFLNLSTSPSSVSFLLVRLEAKWDDCRRREAPRKAKDRVWDDPQTEISSWIAVPLKPAR